MDSVKTHYPSYDVMALQDEWDSNTKEIVLKRLGPFGRCNFLTKKEEELLRLLAQHIVYDDRQEIIDWIIHHIDQQLDTEIGESQRKPDVSPEKTFIREGLKAIDKVFQQNFGKNFAESETQQQFQFVANLQLGKVIGITGWSKMLQKDLFKKLAELIVSAYYSHPTIWSEIGYGGPAYPRGYFRVEFGLADPWEAKKENAAPYGFGEEDKNIGE